MFPLDRVLSRLVGADHRARRSFLRGQSSTAFRGAERHDDVSFRGSERHDDVGFLPGHSSTAFGGAHHPVHGLVPGQGSTAPRGADFRARRVCKRHLEFQLGGQGCACGDRCTFAHSWAELLREASAHEYELASYFDG